MSGHLFEPRSESCVACGMTRLEADRTAANECNSIVEYREWFIPHAMAWLTLPKGTEPPAC